MELLYMMFLHQCLRTWVILLRIFSDAQRDPSVTFSASARLHSAGWSPNQLLSVATLGWSPHAFPLSSAHIKRMLCILGAFPRCGTAAWLVILGPVAEFLRINRLLHAKRFSNPAPAAGKLPSFQCTQFWKERKRSLWAANALQGRDCESRARPDLLCLEPVLGSGLRKPIFVFGVRWKTLMVC